MREVIPLSERKVDWIFLGFFLINAGELVTCTAAIPSDFSSGAGASIAVAFRQPSGIGENETISILALGASRATTATSLGRTAMAP